MNPKLQSRVIALLEALWSDIPEIKWLLYLTKQWSLDDDLLISVEQIMQQAVKQTSDHLLKDKFQKSINLIALIRSKEPRTNETELDQLLQSIL